MSSQSKNLRLIPGSGLVAQSSNANLDLQEGDIVSVGWEFQFPVDISYTSKTEVYGIKNATHQVMLYPLIRSLEEPINTTATLTKIDTGDEIELEFPTSPNYGLLAVLTTDDLEPRFGFKSLDILYIQMNVVQKKKMSWMNQELWIIMLAPVGYVMEDQRIEVRIYSSSVAKNDLTST